MTAGGLMWLAQTQLAADQIEEFDTLIREAYEKAQALNGPGGKAIASTLLGGWGDLCIAGDLERARSHLLSVTNQVQFGWMKIGYYVILKNAFLCTLECMQEKYQQAQKYVNTCHRILFEVESSKSLGVRAVKVSGVAIPVKAVIAWGEALIACGTSHYDQIRSHVATALGYISGKPPDSWLLNQLPSMAVLAAHEGRSQEAGRWLALAFTHPHAMTGWMQQ